MPSTTRCPSGFRQYCRCNPQMTNVQLAKSYRVTAQTIGTWKKLHGIKSHVPDYSDIDDLIRQGKKTPEIMKLTGWSKSTVNKRRRETGHGSGRNYVKKHGDTEQTEPVYPFSTLYEKMLHKKARELGQSEKWVRENWVGGAAWRQTLEGMRG